MLQPDKPAQHSTRQSQVGEEFTIIEMDYVEDEVISTQSIVDDCDMYPDNHKAWRT